MTSQYIFQAELTDGFDSTRAAAICGPLQALIRDEAKTILMVNQDASPAPSSPTPST